MNNILSRIQFGLLVGPLGMIVCLSLLYAYLLLNTATIIFTIFGCVVLEDLVIRNFVEAWKLNHEARYKRAEKLFFLDRGREINYAGVEWEAKRIEYAQWLKLNPNPEPCCPKCGYGSNRLKEQLERLSRYMDSVEKITFEQDGIPYHLQFEKALVELFI